ncbi:hypothetical protein WJX74_009520 [Apatococcus lobatus]|uniref:Uncharacterized protein n=1 Tax=Apatococcus lobatus TaxID=904363 RepID=A0AAW1S2N1_9CHLO
MAMYKALVIECAHDNQVLCLAFNVAKDELYSGSEDTAIKVWDTQHGRLIRRQEGHRSWVTDLLFAADIRMLFSCSLDHTVAAWTDRGQRIQVLDFGSAAFSLGWSVKRRVLAVGGNGELHLYTATPIDGGVLGAATLTAGSSGSACLAPLYAPFRAPDSCHTDIIRDIVCTPAGIIWTISYDGAIFMYEVDRPRAVRRIDTKGSQAIMCSAAFDVINGWLLTGAVDGSLAMWSQEGRCLEVMRDLGGTGTHVTYVPMTRNVWVTGRSGRIGVVDARAPDTITDYVANTCGLESEEGVTMLRQPCGSEVVLAATQSRNLVLWRYEPFAAFRTFMASGGGVECIQCLYDEDGYMTHLFTAMLGGQVLSWALDLEQNLEVYRVQEEFKLHNKPIVAMCYSLELDCLITASEDSTTRVHYLGRVGKALRPRSNPQAKTLPVVTSSSMTRAFVADDDAAVANDRQRQRPASSSSSSPTQSALSSRVPTARNKTGRKMRTLRVPATPPNTASAEGEAEPPRADVILEHRVGMSALALLPAGILISAGLDGSLTTWHLRTGKIICRILDACPGPIQSIAYCNEMREVASCGTGPKIEVWATKPMCQAHGGIVLQAAAAHRLTLHGHSADVTHVCWVDYKGWWISAANDDTLRCWASMGDCLLNIPCSGGSVQCLMVDNANELVMASMLDRVIRAYDLDLGQPIQKYRGHQDLARGLVYLPDKGLYMSGGWDRTLRLWFKSPERGVTLTRVPTAVWGNLEELIFEGSPPSKSLDHIAGDGTRVGKAVLKPPKLLTQKKSLMSRLMQNLSSSTDGKGGTGTADEDQAKASHSRPDTTGLAGLLDSLEGQLRPLSLGKPQPSISSQSGMSAARAARSRMRPAGHKGARGDLPRASFIARTGVKNENLLVSYGSGHNFN